MLDEDDAKVAVGTGFHTFAAVAFVDDDFSCPTALAAGGADCEDTSAITFFTHHCCRNSLLYAAFPAAVPVLVPGVLGAIVRCAVHDDAGDERVVRDTRQDALVQAG